MWIALLPKQYAGNICSCEFNVPHITLAFFAPPPPTNKPQRQLLKLKKQMMRMGFFGASVIFVVDSILILILMSISCAPSLNWSLCALSSLSFPSLSCALSLSLYICLSSALRMFSCLPLAIVLLLFLAPLSHRRRIAWPRKSARCCWYSFSTAFSSASCTFSFSLLFHRSLPLSLPHMQTHIHTKGTIMLTLH